MKLSLRLFFSLNAFMISFVSMLSTSSLCTFMRAKFEHLELVIVLLRQVLRRRNVEKLRSASQLVTGRVRSTRYMRFRLLNILLFANASVQFSAGSLGSDSMKISSSDLTGICWFRRLKKLILGSAEKLGGAGLRPIAPRSSKNLMGQRLIAPRGYIRP